MNYISLETAKQLKAWGCEVLCKNFTQAGHSKGTAYSYGSISDSGDSSCVHEYKKSQFINAYSLNEIICNGEMAKAFFGEEFLEIPGHFFASGSPRKKPANIFHSFEIMSMIQESKQKDAEKYLLKNCVFNPKNKEDLLGETHGFKEDIDLLNSL